MSAKTVSKVKNKAKNALKKTGEFSVENPKKVLFIIGGAAALFITVKMIKGIYDTANTISGNNIDNEIDVLEGISIDHSKLSITDQEAIQFASALLEAMNWFGFVFPIGYTHGTDTDVIHSVFDRINSEDFKLIVKKFDKKDYDGVGSPDANLIGGVQDALGISEKRDLVYWLRAEINKTFDFILFDKVKSIVEEAGFIFS